MSERISTEYATRIMKAHSPEELAFIAADIKVTCDKDPEFKKIWRAWLLCIYDSALKTLTAPELIPEECLNKEGLKALERGEITL